MLVAKAVIVAALFAVAVAESPPPNCENERRGATERKQYVPIGSRIPRWTDPVLASEREAIRVMHAFAACVARTHQKQAIALLATAPDSADQKKIVSALVGRGSSCLQDAREMRLTSSLFRGAIAEALYKSEVRIQQQQLVNQAPPATFNAIAGHFLTRKRCADEDDRAWVLGKWVAYCAVHEDPDAVRRFLATEPGSSEEANGLQSLEALFNGCLLQDHVLRVDQLTMRALLAEALYQRSVGRTA